MKSSLHLGAGGMGEVYRARIRPLLASNDPPWPLPATLYFVSDWLTVRWQVTGSGLVAKH